MENESGAKIAIRGKGSVKEGKGRSDAAHSSNQEEDLHCLIMAESEEKINKAKQLIHNVIETVSRDPRRCKRVANISQAASIPEGQNELKRNQLRELAALNGTLRDDENQACQNCGKIGHRKYDCPEKQNYTASIICRVCGNAGHMARDCPDRQKGASWRNDGRPAAKVGGGDAVDREMEVSSLPLALFDDLTLILRSNSCRNSVAALPPHRSKPVLAGTIRVAPNLRSPGSVARPALLLPGALAIKTLEMMEALRPGPVTAAAETTTVAATVSRTTTVDREDMVKATTKVTVSRVQHPGSNNRRLPVTVAMLGMVATEVLLLVLAHLLACLRVLRRVWSPRVLTLSSSNTRRLLLLHPLRERPRRRLPVTSHHLHPLASNLLPLRRATRECLSTLDHLTAGAHHLT